jgi:TetR/AcrR family transcriptional regulator, cholesterol catabolism regulator
MGKTVALKSTSRKEQILEIATRLFHEKGYNATSMRHLAENMGMEAASLYNHISGKDELLQQICFGMATHYNGHMETVENESIRPIERVEKLVRFHIEMMLTHFEDVYVTNRDWKHLKEPLLGNFLQQRKAYEKRFAQLIQQAIDAGEIKPVHPHAAVLTILSAVRGIEFWHRNPRNISASQLEEDMVRILLHGLQKL